MSEQNRRASYEKRLKDKGFVKLTVWADRETADEIRKLAGESRKRGGIGVAD